MKKKVLSVLLAVSMVAALSGCGVQNAAPAASEAAPAASEAAPASSAAEETASTEAPAETEASTAAAAADAITLVMAEVNPVEGTTVGQTDQFFADKIKELTNGSVVVDLQASGVLGSESDVLDTMLGGGGTIDMSRISAFALTSYGAKKSKLLSIPYTFTGREHYWNFVHSDLAADFLNEPEELGLGVRGIFYGEEGFRHFFSKTPVSSMEDLKGMKIRVSEDPIMTGMVEGLGASPTVVAMNELYSALQTGVVDAAEQPIANYKANAFNEVANNVILDGHTLGAVEVIISDAAWAKLSADQQAAVTEAGKQAEDYMKDLSQKNEDAVLAELKADGCNIVEVTDQTPWKEACKKVIEENTSDQAELYQQILDMAPKTN